MANRLKKLAEVRYSPGTPYQPAVPGYCVLVPYLVPGYQTFDISYLLGENGELVSIVGESTGYVPATTIYRKVCYAAVPEVQATPPTATYTAVNGWNGGARSVSQLDADGYYEFQINTAPAGVVVGLSFVDSNTLPSEPTHAVYAHGSTLDIMESGVVVHTAPVAHTFANVYRIQRVGLTVTYSGPGWSYESLAGAAGARFLDAAIYASGSFVDNPTLTELEFTGAAAGALGSIQGYAYEGDYAEAYGVLGALVGDARQTQVVSASGTLSPLVGVAYEGSYAHGGGTLLPLLGEANGGYPQVSLIYGAGAIPSAAGVAVGLTGEVGTVTASLGALGGWASEGAYAECFGTLGTLKGYADSGWPVPGETYAGEVVLVGDYVLAVDTQLGTINSQLEVDGTFDTAVLMEDSVYDALALADSATATQAIEAAIAMSMLLSNDISSLVSSDETRAAGRLIGAEPAQYAVNLVTGALTNYSGFSFSAFATVGQTLYGAKADGVYRARLGDDDGAGILAYVDFGSSDMGSAARKYLDTVYLGVSTDGQLYTRINNGVSDRTYRVVQRGDMRRVTPARGVSARLWNIELEIVDATEFELDLVEMEVGVTSRRWGRK